LKTFNNIKLFSLYNAVALDSSSKVSSIIDLSYTESLVMSILYTTTAGNVDITYETSLDKVTWFTQAAPATLADLTVGTEHMAFTIAVLTKYIRFTATEDTAATVFTAMLAIR